MDATSDTNPSIAIVIVNYRTAELTLKCVAALAKERKAGLGFDVVVVDGGSGDGSAEILNEQVAAHFSDFCTFLPLAINGGFGWANNQAILPLLQQDHPPDYIYLLNPDALALPGAVLDLVTALDADPRRGAVGSRLLEVNGAVSGSAFRFPSIAREFVRGTRFAAVGRALGIAPVMIERDDPCRVDWLTGASVMFRSAALRDVGLFDDGFFLYFEEVELMWRLARAGWECWHIPSSQVTHIGGAATGVDHGHAQDTGPKRLPDYWFRSRKRYFALTGGRWAALLANIAWLCGDTLWKVADMVGMGRGKKGVPHERQDLIAHGLCADQVECAPARVSYSGRPGVAPAWMRAAS